MLLSNAHLQNIFDLWNGVGLDDSKFDCFAAYARAMNGQALSVSMSEHIDSINLARSAIDEREDLAVLCATGDPRVTMYYAKLQQLTRFIKSETASLLGLSITYSSGDGD